MDKQVLYKEVIAAVQSDATAKGKWARVGRMVAEAYSDEPALVADKVSFCANAIIPALRPELRDALAADIPRKGTEAYDIDPAKFDALKALRKDATATRDTLFKTVCNNAWPKERTVPVPLELTVWLRPHLQAISTKLDKAYVTGAAYAFNIFKMKQAIATAYALLPRE